MNDYERRRRGGRSKDVTEAEKLKREKEKEAERTRKENSCVSEEKTRPSGVLPSQAFVFMKKTPSLSNSLPSGRVRSNCVHVKEQLWGEIQEWVLWGFLL